MATPAITLEDVSKSFRRQSVLDGVTLTVSQGERVVLVGPNGAGKTTLIRCLLGEYGCEGRVQLSGLDPRSRRGEVLQRIGFVPQLPPPLRMPVSQLIRFASGLCHTDPEATIDIATRLGLDIRSIWGQAFAKLSGGQKQKLLIAIALRRGAELLILDEPAANLDPEARRTFYALLADRDDPSTMVISSHRLDEVSAIASRVVELDQGRIVLDEAIANAGALGSTFHCYIELLRPEASAAETFRTWGFTAQNGVTLWEGSIAGPDRLRFFGMISRYSGLVSSLRLEDASRGDGS